MENTVIKEKTDVKSKQQVDLAHFVMEAFGVTYPKPDPEVQKQWATFEAMIELMTPAGFAEIMQSMWPELIDAMPLGMGRQP